MTELHTLDADHPLRNTPLIEIKGQYKHIGDKVYREIFPNFAIAKVTYNELKEVWTKNSIFIGETK
jgi:hypothetical protein